MHLFKNTTLNKFKFKTTDKNKNPFFINYNMLSERYVITISKQIYI